MAMTQNEIEKYLIDVEYFKRDFFNDSVLALLLKEYTGFVGDDIEWTEIIQCLFNFVKVYKEKS